LLVAPGEFDERELAKSVERLGLSPPEVGLPAAGREGAAHSTVRSTAGFRLDAHSVVDGVAKLLPAPEVSLRGLDGDMPQQELNLI
jgi:hypothetical protein